MSLHLLDQRPPEPPDEGRRGLEAAIEIDCRDQGLASIGENSGIAPGPCGGLGARQDEIPSEPDRLRDPGKRLAADKVGMPAGEMALGLVLEAPP